MADRRRRTTRRQGPDAEVEQLPGPRQIVADERHHRLDAGAPGGHLERCVRPPRGSIESRRHRSQITPCSGSGGRHHLGHRLYPVQPDARGKLRSTAPHRLARARTLDDQSAIGEQLVDVAHPTEHPAVERQAAGFHQGGGRFRVEQFDRAERE